MPNTIYGLKIFSSEQIKKLDASTIEKEGITSVELMERASEAFVKEFTRFYSKDKPVTILCGLGNNGGDGMAIARMLMNRAYNVNVFVVSFDNSTASKEFTAEFLKLEDMIDIRQITQRRDIPVFDAEAVIIDAMLGSGINRIVTGLLAEVITTVNKTRCEIVAVDIASGLFSSRTNLEQAIIQPTFTFSFQIPKLAFFLPQNQFYVGELRFLDIGLNQDFINIEPTPYVLVDKKSIIKLVKKRAKFSHKGNFGHVMLFAGSNGKTGASMLASKGALRAGCGLVTILTEERDTPIVQGGIWEAMCVSYKTTDAIPSLPDNKNFTLGIGPGIGLGEHSLRFLEYFLKYNSKPIVIDADGLNLISQNQHLLKFIPVKSILTPHPKEFERLAGNWSDDYERLEKQRGYSITHNIYIVLKGAHSSITTPEGFVYINSTGNAGMATAGSGDVLTGIITSFLAQNYSPEQACILGVFLHGLAGDLAASEIGQHSLMAGDIIEFLPLAFKELMIV
ncbi:MAG: NAD(P)H-hydrate dehydratase [Opitutaceae bacterium]|nr:NAD(P)H-hydrate dehydratase [Cytophagales bacterium]